MEMRPPAHPMWSCGPSWDWKHQLERLYGYVPVWAQNLGITLYGISYRRERLGGVFDKYVAEFRARDRWPDERMQAFLEKRLRTVLSHAFREVPYYRQRWTAAGLENKDLEQLALPQLSQIPITPKLDLIGNADSFLAEDVVAQTKLHHYYSSGSTGSPVTSIISSEDHQRFLAAREARSFRWARTSLRLPRAMVGGRQVVPSHESGPPYYRYNWCERQVYFSAYHISRARVRDYVAGFHRYRPKVLTGYAHSYYTLACMMLEQGIRLQYTPAALILGSEKLTPEMKTVIQEAFRARPYEEYGAVENCVLATECESGSLHVNPDFGIVEIVDEQGMPVPVGTEGRIVCTGVLNHTQPLVRYDIGDVGLLSESKCACGRSQLPVLREVIGRVEDVVIGLDGRQMVRFHGLFINLPHVLEGQVIQEALNFVRVRVVARRGFGPAEQQLIRQRMRERLGNVRVEVECVDAIERTHRGKFRAVISHLPADARQTVSALSATAGTH